MKSEPVNARIDGRAAQVGDPMVLYKLLQSIILQLFSVPVSNSSLSPNVDTVVDQNDENISVW